MAIVEHSHYLRETDYDPLGYADYLEEYAEALQNVGNSAEAKKFRDRAVDHRKPFPGKRASNDKTPYVTQCKSP